MRFKGPYTSAVWVLIIYIPDNIRVCVCVCVCVYVYENNNKEVSFNFLGFYINVNLKDDIFKKVEVE
jgi:hypothetical protein